MRFSMNMSTLRLIFKSLFIENSNSSLIQSLRYVFVGGGAFLVDSLLLYILTKFGLHYLISASLAFLFGLTVNFFLSKKFIFTKASQITTPLGEFFAYGLIGVIGLALTELFMFLFTSVIGFYFMISKISSSVIILGWNFFARKLFLYRK